MHTLTNTYYSNFFLVMYEVINNHLHHKQANLGEFKHTIQKRYKTTLNYQHTTHTSSYTHIISPCMFKLSIYIVRSYQKYIYRHFLFYEQNFENRLCYILVGPDPLNKITDPDPPSLYCIPFIDLWEGRI